MKTFYRLIHGHVLTVLPSLAAESVNVVVTSPPYWGLRDYGVGAAAIWDGDNDCEHKWGSDIKAGGRVGEPWSNTEKTAYLNFQDGQTVSVFCSKCGAWRGQLGLEPHPVLYISHLVAVCRELRRVLRRDGSLYLNLGDTYCSNWGGGRKGSWMSPKTGDEEGKGWGVIDTPIEANWARKVATSESEKNWLQPKQLLMIPSRVAIALQEDGWILRNAIVWSKPNAMPSSVKDRLSTTYEFVFHLVQSRKYWYDLDAIRRPYKPLNRWGGNTIKVPQNKKADTSPYAIQYRERLDQPNPRGKNPGDVWRIPTRPFKGAHFAVFPPALVEPIVTSSCPQWVCERCNKPRSRLLEKSGRIQQHWAPGTEKKTEQATGKHGETSTLVSGFKFIYKTVGWSDCGCNAGWRPGIVLDPFVGSGTTMRVARDLGRSCIGIDCVEAYCEMAKKRVFGKRFLDRDVEYCFEEA